MIWIVIVSVLVICGFLGAIASQLEQITTLLMNAAEDRERQMHLLRLLASDRESLGRGGSHDRACGSSRSAFGE